jgi:WD40-like Beta Propeller Repeat
MEEIGSANTIRYPGTVFASLALILGVGMASGCGGGGGNGGGTVTNPPPPPQIKLVGISPYEVPNSGNNFVVAGASSFTLLAGGIGFTASSQILWNGTALTTTFGDASDLSAAVPAALVASPGTASITVHDSSLGVTSNALPFGVASAAAATAGVTQLITIGADGSPANNDSLVQPSISTSGRFVAFQSSATNLAPGPASGYQEIYERDTCIGAPTGCTPATIRISVTNDGTPVNFHSHDSAVSADGRYVAFDSAATNILENTSTCASPSECVFLRDTCTGVATACTPRTVLVSVNSNGNAAGGGSPSMSPNGRFIAFQSNVANLAGGAPGGYPITYLRDTCNGAPSGCTPATLLVSAASDGTPAGANSINEAVSANGGYVAFSSYAQNLGESNPNNEPGVFLRDTCVDVPGGCTPGTSKIDISTAGVMANDALSVGFGPALSGDGRIVAFSSQATNLVSPPLTVTGKVYMRDTCNGAAAGCSPTTILVSVANDGSLPNASQNNETMSSDGRFVAFASLASNLVPGDSFAANAWKDIFIRDTCYGATAGCMPSTVRVSVTSTPNFNTESNALSDYPVISGDGHYVVFLSSSTNLVSSVPGNGHWMVYLAKTGF